MSGPAPLYLALACYLVAGIAVTLGRRRGGKGVLVPIAVGLAGIALQLAFLVARTRATGFLPFASRFESMALFALAVQVTGTIVFALTGRHSAKAGTDWFSALLLVGALVPVGFHAGGDLNPILNSPWFAFHILVSFAGYGCFVAGMIWSIVTFADRLLDLNPRVPRKLALAGLVLLGTGIVTGSAWADASWGTYWNWDPKESWALLTWTLMLGYVHIAGPNPRRWVTALFYVLAFLSMMFTFIGINLLKFGLHRY